MKLLYFRGAVSNFGDELNAHLWQRLLPEGFLDSDERELFLGIGSIIGDHPSKSARKHVVGSGYGGYTNLPDLNDGTWNIVFVRGPRTAALLDLPPEKAIGDGALLLRAIDLPAPAPHSGPAYMPHFQSLERGLWPEACERAGLRMIDPTGPVQDILAELRSASVLITEAMHGAIVADALRVPWIAVRPIHSQHHSKWLDWAESLGIELRQHELRPSSLLESYVGRTARNTYDWGHGSGRLHQISHSRIARPLNQFMIDRAAKRLGEIAQQEAQLSEDGRLESATDRAMSALDAFVRSKGFGGIAPRAGDRTGQLSPQVS